MSHSESIVFAVAVVILVVALSAFARRLPVPTPILQLAAGFGVALIPGIVVPDLDPELVFFVFLPPVIWSAAMFTSLRDFRRSIGPITTLAVGLVIATTVAVAFVARQLFPGLPWAAAIALGAIVSPPDAVAATTIVSRLIVPRRVITILEGESLVNDASALILYRTAVAAAVTGSFSWGESIVRFFIDSGVGSSSTTTLSQNAVRRRKNMTLPFVPSSLVAALEDTLAEAIEGEVGSVRSILRMFEPSF